MKQFKTYVAIILLMSVLIVPSIALAAWWNPLTWNWNIFDIFETHTTATVPASKISPTTIAENQATNSSTNSNSQKTNTTSAPVTVPTPKPVSAPTSVCPQYMTAVCGTDGKTYYGNSCLGYGMPSNVTLAIQGACVVSTPIPTPIPTSTPVPEPTATQCGDSILQTPSLILSETTPAQYILDGFNGTAQSQATYKFTSNVGGAPQITELKFTITGAHGSSYGAATSQICVNSVCADAGSGGADLRFGSSLSVPSGGGLTANVQVFYSGLGTGVNSSGLTVAKQGSGTTAVLNLTYVEYMYGSSQGGSLKCSITTPAITLVGSLPSVTVPSNNTSGLILGAESQIGQVSIADNGQDDLKVRTITFNVGSSGFSGNPTITNPFISTDPNNTPISGSSCAVSGKTIICALGTSYSTDFDISAGQTQTFDLFAEVDGTNSFGTAAASISSWLSPSGFVWDDTSANGNSGAGLTGSQIYGFPINTWSIHQ